MARGAVKVVSINGALTVTFTAASGATPTVFSDEACTSTTALPATIADGANAIFYFASPGSYTLSVKTASGVQIAGDLNTTKVVTVSAGDVGVYAYDTRLVSRDASGDSGRHSPGTDLATTYAPLSASLNYLPTKDWLTSWARTAFDKPAPQHIPVVTFTSSMVTTMSSPVVTKPQKVGIGSQTTGWDGLSDPNIRYFSGVFDTANGGSSDLGLYGSTKPGGGGQAARWPLVWDHLTSAGVDTVEIAGYASAGSQLFLIEVNGCLINDVSWKHPNSAVGGWTMKLTFPNAEARRIRIWNTGECGLSEIRVNTGQSISKPAGAIQRRVAIIGDSYVNGAGGQAQGAQGTSNIDTWAPRLARLMGADDMILAGIGGTGFVAGQDLSNGNASNAYGTRLATVLGMSPHVLVANGSVNDGVAGTGVQAAVAAFVTAAAAVSEVYITGVMLTAYAANSAAVQAATVAAGRPYLDVDAFMFGSGRVDNKQGDGNRDFFLLPDNTHGDIAFHKAVTETLFRLYKQARP